MTSDHQQRRYRLSDRLSGTLPATFEGRLDKRFFPYFDYLLDSEHTPEEHSEFYDVYVPNPKFEDKFRRLISSPRSNITPITGARGIGKSTSIRYFFGASTQPKLISLSRIFDRSNGGNRDICVVIPFYLDTHNITEENVERILTAQIQSAAELVAREKDINLSDSEVFDFVHTHKSQLVTYPELPLEASVSDRMRQFRGKNIYGYVTELLKFTLHMSDVNRVILVVDDIESSPYEVQKALVKGVFKLRDCLRNVGALKRSYIPDYIFTCRPATFTMLKADPEIDGFSIGYAIELKEPAPLGEIVKKRFDYAIKVIGEGKKFANMEGLSDVENLESWRDAYSALNMIIKRLSHLGSSFIVDICNHDIRRALTDFQEILRNSRWYEAFSHSAGAFTVQEMDFQFSSSGVIRAMVLRDHDFFSEELESSIPNLFFNREPHDADLMLIHVVKFFFEKTRSHRVVAIKKPMIKAALKSCYPPDFVNENFDDILNYARNEEILREERVRDLRRTETYVIPLPKAFRLWQLCGKSSVFLEFFRDNTFLEHSRVVDYPKARTIGTSRLSADEKFVLCGDFVCEIARSEIELYERIRTSGSAQSKYKKLFGSRSVSRHLFLGLSASMRRHYKSPSSVVVPRDVSISRKKASKLSLRAKDFLDAL